MLSNPFGEVPILPAAAAFGAAVLVLLLILLRREMRFSWPRAAVAAVIALYSAGVVANTIFPIFLTPAPSEGPWSPAVALVPFYDYEVADALTNLAVFVPLGILVPLLLRHPSWPRVMVTAAAVSLSIEMLQLAAQRLFSGGHVADVNDLIWNTIGAAVGYTMLVLSLRAPVLSSLVDRFRWHVPTHTAPSD